MFTAFSDSCCVSCLSCFLTLSVSHSSDDLCQPTPTSGSRNLLSRPLLQPLFQPKTQTTRFSWPPHLKIPTSLHAFCASSLSSVFCDSSFFFFFMDTHFHGLSSYPIHLYVLPSLLPSLRDFSLAVSLGVLGSFCQAIFMSRDFSFSLIHGDLD